MICCEICNRAGDECAETGTPIDWSDFGITVMPDCPERKESDYDEQFSDSLKDSGNND